MNKNLKLLIGIFLVMLLFLSCTSTRTYNNGCSMNRSFSKIRHIQNTNKKLEKRFLKESEEEFDLYDETPIDPEETPSDFYSDPIEIEDYGFDYEEEDEENKKFKEFLKKKFKLASVSRPIKRWEKGDEDYKPYNPIKSTDVDLSTYLKSLKNK